MLTQVAVRKRVKIEPHTSITLVYRPDHPRAGSNGMVNKAWVFEPCSSSAPYVISDTMDSTRHMADGQFYTSKAKFRETTKAHGCVEVGNESAYLNKPRPKVQLSKEKRVDDIKKAIYQLKNEPRKRKR